jgi:hypothetical protein
MCPWGKQTGFSRFSCPFIIRRFPNVPKNFWFFIVFDGLIHYFACCLALFRLKAEKSV